ncbi:hypothetical protein NUSPORA_03015 [Nucleospora cyclopteri]
MQCFLILKLCTVYLSIQNLLINTLNSVFKSILCELISILESFISKKVLDSTIMLKKCLIKIILQQLKKTKMLCESFIIDTNKNLKNSIIRNYILLTYNFNVLFYEISNDYFVENFSNMYNFEIIIKRFNYNISKTKTAEKPKTIWLKRWKEFEKNTYNIKN